jgi:hypothetical protein
LVLLNDALGLVVADAHESVQAEIVLFAAFVAIVDAGIELLLSTQTLFFEGVDPIVQVFLLQLPKGVACAAGVDAFDVMCFHQTIDLKDGLLLFLYLFEVVIDVLGLAMRLVDEVCAV